MKDTATINGVTITREQIRDALEEMNRPDPLVAGDIVMQGAGKGPFLVIQGDLKFDPIWHFEAKQLKGCIFLTDGHGVYAVPPDSCSKHAALKWFIPK